MVVIYFFEQSEEVISVNLTKFSPNKDFSMASQWILGTWLFFGGLGGGEI